MTEFAKQLQEMVEATVKVAIEPMTEENVQEFNELIKTEEFKEVKSYFNDTDNLVNIFAEEKPEAFEIVLEKLNNQAPIQTFKNENLSMTIYSDSNTGYVVLMKEVETQKPYAIFWNA